MDLTPNGFSHACPGSLESRLSLDSSQYRNDRLKGYLGKSVSGITSLFSWRLAAAMDTWCPAQKSCPASFKMVRAGDSVLLMMA